MINEWNGGEENDGVADDDGDDDDGDGGGEGVKYNWSHWRWNVYCAQELGRENVQKAERQQKQNGQPWIILFPFSHFLRVEYRSQRRWHNKNFLFLLAFWPRK